MDNQEQQSEQDQPARSSQVQEWFDHTFLQFNGPLTFANVLEYFSKSPFFDPQCAHAKLMTRGQDPWDEKELKEFKKSIQYRVRPDIHGTDFQPFFVIDQCYVERLEGVETSIRTGTFVVQGISILPTPDIYSVVKNRLENSKDLIDRTFGAMESATMYSQEKGTEWISTEVTRTNVPTTVDTTTEFSWKNKLKNITL